LENWKKVFQKYRLEFCHDEKTDKKGLFDSLHLPDIKKLRIENNKFTLKHKIRLKMLSILCNSDPK
jgi:hypothetical protein